MIYERKYIIYYIFYLCMNVIFFNSSDLLLVMCITDLFYFFLYECDMIINFQKIKTNYIYEIKPFYFLCLNYNIHGKCKIF